jgi:hypothetical protein
VRTRTAHEFAESLRTLHITCGKPSYLRICALAKEYGDHLLSPATISEVLNAKRLPKVEFLVSFVRALLRHRDAGCPDRHEAEIRRWRQKWQEVVLQSMPALTGDGGRCVHCGRACAGE